MPHDEPFALFDCGLARCASGRNCSNLRELLDAVRIVPESVLEHHMQRCALDDHFELYEFPNDLARWCWDALGDRVLGEQIALVDPYQCGSLAGVRHALSDIVEERLWSLERVPWCRSGLELHLVESRLIAYDTGERVHQPAGLVELIERIPLRSLFYHVHEARRRTGNYTDDFSQWLENRRADPAIVAKVRSIDFYFLNLNQLRENLAEVFHEHFGGTRLRVEREVA